MPCLLLALKALVRIWMVSHSVFALATSVTPAVVLSQSPKNRASLIVVPLSCSALTPARSAVSAPPGEPPSSPPQAARRPAAVTGITRRARPRRTDIRMVFLLPAVGRDGRGT